MTTSTNLEQTAKSLTTEWTVANEFENEGNNKMAVHCWESIQNELDGMFKMANYVLHCDETMAFIRDLKVIARIHHNRTFLNK